MDVREIVERDYAIRNDDFRQISFDGYTDDMVVYAKYIIGTLMDNDRLITQEALDDFVLNSASVRGLFHMDIPEQIYLDYVVQPRINNEQLDASRHVFYECVKAFIQKDIVSTLFAVNTWMIEMVQYRSTDARTQNPSLTLQTGIGRCGEKSTFLVHAYRSLGIPARQIYAPWWSHCDDRHAWVEVYVEGRWYALGAGDSGHQFNQAWFMDSAAKALIVRTNQFSNLCSSESVLEKHGIHTVLNVTDHYAKTRALEITVSVASCSAVMISIINYGVFRNVATCTLTDGKATVELGPGTCFVRIFDGKNMFVKPVTESMDAVEITEHDILTESGIDIYQICGNQKTAFPQASSEELEDNARIKAAGLKRYQKRMKGVTPESVNQTAYQKLFNALGETEAHEIIACLTEKDCYDFDADDLIRYVQRVSSYKADFPPEVYRTALLNPRVSSETLDFDVDQCAHYPIHDPDELYAHLMTTLCHDSPYRMVDTLMPIRCMLKGIPGTFQDIQHLFVMICRCKGIPARLCRTTQGLEIYDTADFRPVPSISTKVLTLNGMNDTVQYALTPLLLPHDTGQYLLSEPEHVLPIGDYCLYTTKRLPDGTVTGRVQRICLDDNKSMTLDVLENRAESMFENVELGGVMSSDWVTPLTIVCFGKADEEPTQHVLNELIAMKPMIASENIGIHYYGSEDHHPMIEKLKYHLPGTTVHVTWSKAWESRLAARHNRDMNQYPLTLIIKDRKTLLSSSGYQVGFIQSEVFKEIAGGFKDES